MNPIFEFREPVDVTLSHGEDALAAAHVNATMCKRYTGAELDYRGRVS